MIRGLIQRVFGFKRFSEKIYPASQLGIDKRYVSRGALRLVRTLQEAGFQAYIVGGAVRDLLMNKSPKDFDVATSASPEEIVRLFRRAWIIGRRFRIVHVRQGIEVIEVTTFRGDGPVSTDENGQILRDNSFGTHAEDARRRDFTVNALYYDPCADVVHDFHHGIDDIRSKTLRIIGRPEIRFREDPVRMLRAIRFSGKLAFELEPKARKLLSVLAPLLNNVSEARRFDEITKLLMCGASFACLRRLYQEKLYHVLFPLLNDVFSVPEACHFVELALIDTDRRIHAGKPVNLAFPFAALLWWSVKARWIELREQMPLYLALQQAAEEILRKQFRGTAVPRRLFSDAREIWQLQPLFENRKGKRPYRLAQHPRFRLAFDFLLRRCEAGDLDASVANWWVAFLDNLPSASIETPSVSESENRSKPRRRRRKARQSRKEATESGFCSTVA